MRRRVRHRLGGAGKERAERAAEAFRETERDGVEARRRSSRRPSPLRDRGVQQPGAVEVEAEAELGAAAAELVDLLERPDPPARSRCGCSRARATRRARRMDRRDAVCGAHLLDAEPPGSAGKPSRDDARVDGRAAELGDERRASSPRRGARRRARCGGGARSGSPSSRSGGRWPRPGRAARLREPRRSLTVGSSRFCSSPTTAAAIAARMPAVGCVAVSERRSITGARSYL